MLKQALFCLTILGASLSSFSAVCEDELNTSGIDNATNNQFNQLSTSNIYYADVELGLISVKGPQRDLFPIAVVTLAGTGLSSQPHDYTPESSSLSTTLRLGRELGKDSSLKLLGNNLRVEAETTFWELDDSSNGQLQASAGNTIASFAAPGTGANDLSAAIFTNSKSELDYVDVNIGLRGDSTFSLKPIETYMGFTYINLSQKDNHVFVNTGNVTDLFRVASSVDADYYGLMFGIKTKKLILGETSLSLGTRVSLMEVHARMSENYASEGTVVGAGRFSDKDNHFAAKISARFELSRQINQMEIGMYVDGFWLSDAPVSNAISAPLGSDIFQQNASTIGFEDIYGWGIGARATYFFR